MGVRGENEDEEGEGGGDTGTGVREYEGKEEEKKEGVIGEKNGSLDEKKEAEERGSVLRVENEGTNTKAQIRRHREEGGEEVGK